MRLVAGIGVGGWGWGGCAVRWHTSPSVAAPRRNSRPVVQRGHGDDAAGGGEDRLSHCGGSDGVSCARGDRRQVSTNELSDRDMKYGLGLGGCGLQPPPREEKTSLGPYDPQGQPMVQPVPLSSLPP
jgi:hypothetical protein